jgi:hypothetical protein
MLVFEHMVGDLLTVLIKFMTEKGRKVKKDLASFLVFLQN